MKEWNRREWLAVTSGGLMMPPVGSNSGQTRGAQASAQGGALALDAYQPASMLRVAETKVERPRFPVIDIHSHLSWSGRAGAGAEDAQAVTVLAPAAEVLSVMDRKGVRLMVNLTGGRGTSGIDVHAIADDERGDVLAVPGVRDRKSRAGRRSRIEGAEDAWSLPARRRTDRTTREDR